MRAVLCRTYGPPESLVVEEVPEPAAGPGQLVVDVEACALNFPDVLMIQDLYQFRPGLPFTPGTEVAGTVSSVGAGVTAVRVGDRVLRVDGARRRWPSRSRMDATAAIALPEGADAAQAAGFLNAYGTSYHALSDRAGLQAGETLLVLGAAGGVRARRGGARCADGSNGDRRGVHRGQAGDVPRARRRAHDQLRDRRPQDSGEGADGRAGRRRGVRPGRRTRTPSRRCAPRHGRAGSS